MLSYMHEGANREQVLYVCSRSMYVCMFKTPLPVVDFEHTYIHIEHTYIERQRFAPSRKSRAKRVCFKTPLACEGF